MVEMTLIPSWDEVAASYPYAPGRGDMSDAEWKVLRTADKETRKAAREAKKAERELARYDAKWNDMVQEQYVKDSSELPGRNPWWALGTRAENPQSKTDVGLAVGMGAARPFTWLGEQAAKLLLGEDEEKTPDLKKWMEQYLASGGGYGSSAGAGLGAGAGTPFPSLRGYVPNWEKLSKAAQVKEPQYQEEAFNPQLAMANMLMNADWINMDMSKAGAVMQDAFNRRARNNADVANANEEARAKQEQWTAMRELALEEMKAQSAMQQAELAMRTWQMQQPRALGGNRMSWTDAAGNVHFQQIDKQGEARTVGSNAAMIDMVSTKGEMTPKKILQKAQAAAMLYPDANKVPFINGYMQQAMMMLPQEE